MVLPGEACDLVPYELDRGDLNQVERIRQAVYDRWEWNYGTSPGVRSTSAAG